MPTGPENDNYKTRDLQDVGPEDTEAGIPDRDDTGGGPRGGNTVDGRTGPGQVGAQGAPESSMRDAKDYSGDGNLGRLGGQDEMRPMGGWDQDPAKIDRQVKKPGSEE